VINNIDNILLISQSR